MLKLDSSKINWPRGVIKTHVNIKDGELCEYPCYAFTPSFFMNHLAHWQYFDTDSTWVTYILNNLQGYPFRVIFYSSLFWKLVKWKKDLTNKAMKKQGICSLTFNLVNLIIAKLQKMIIDFLTFVWLFCGY